MQEVRKPLAVVLARLAAPSREEAPFQGTALEKQEAGLRAASERERLVQLPLLATKFQFWKAVFEPAWRGRLAAVEE
jgi:hypothetical protein